MIGTKIKKYTACRALDYRQTGLSWIMDLADIITENILFWKASLTVPPASRSSPDSRELPGWTGKAVILTGARTFPFLVIPDLEGGSCLLGLTDVLGMDLLRIGPYLAGINKSSAFASDIPGPRGGGSYEWVT